MSNAAIVRHVEEANGERRVHIKLNARQGEFFDLEGEIGGPIKYIDLEGSVRAGKSTAPAAKLASYAIRYPGIHLAAARWTQDGLDAQVRPLWRQVARELGLRLQWHPDEEYDEVVGTDSRVYLRALKASEETARYSKLAGLTLSVLWLDQAEECPRDVIEAYVPARLSQPGYPHEFWATPNPPGMSHWLCEWFPEDPSKLRPHHHFIRTTVYDNREVLGDAYIADLEAKYPPGSALRRRFVDGRRGLASAGDPVYAGYFRREMHVDERLQMDPTSALLEGWDFGHRHPAVVWGQIVLGELRLLGGVMGDAMFIEDFAPAALAIQREWFPEPLEIRTTCDPAVSNQGTKISARAVLASLGRNPQIIPTANHPASRDAAIQAIAGYMRRLTSTGPAFRIHPRFRVIGTSYTRVEEVLVDGLEAGYVWDPHEKTPRRPKKDGYFDHSANATEYLVLKYGEARVKVAEQDAPGSVRDPFEAWTRAHGPASQGGPRAWMGN